MILITGATGLIGRALVAQYMQSGQALRLQVRSKDLLKSIFPEIEKQKQIEIIEYDFLQEDASKVLEMCRSCSAIIHTAALVHQPQAEENLYEILNFRATELLAMSAKQNQIKQFIFLSTIAVYGSAPLNAASEEQPTSPDTLYGVSKLSCEEYLLENEIAPSLIIFRPALVFGEGDRGNMLSLMRQIAKGLYFQIGEGSARKSLICSADLAKAISLGLERFLPGSHVFNIANPEPVTIKDLANSISRIIGSKKQIPSVPEYFVRFAANIASLIFGSRCPLTPARVDRLTQSSHVSIKKFQEFSGFRASYTLEQALTEEIEWAKASSHF